jgi:cell division protein FtsN
MAAKRNQQQAFRETQRQSWPAWVWLGLGVLLGLTLSAIMLIKDWVPQLHKKNLPQPNPEASAPKESEQAVVDEAGKKPTAPKKTYDFYSVLPEMEVVIPDAELSAKAKAEQQRQQALTQNQANAQTPATTPPAGDSTMRYFLQTGSYPDPKGADEAKAKLALLGFIARVQPITINGKTWNRVRVGPYNSASELETAKKSLADSGISAIALKEAQTP